MAASGAPERNSTFCVYPWIEQVVQSNGKFSFCCVAQNGGMIPKDDGGFYRAGEHRLEEAWNSQYMRDVRKAMLNNQPVEACKLCYFQESIGKKSYREMHNEEWQKNVPKELAQRIEKSEQQAYQVDVPALYLDLRLGNLCNLKCRSCNPYNSSQIFRETVQLLEKDPDFKNVYQKYYGGPPTETAPWFEKDEFWDEVIAAIPQIRKVYLTGGEPTLIEKNYKFLNACVDSGHSKNIFLMFNTNCTNIQDRFLELLPHFQFVLMNASIDGFGSDNEYIRYLSKWESTDRNLQKLLQAKGNIQVGVTPVIQNYNILKITELLSYIEGLSGKYNRSINVDFLYATHPECLDVSMLPESVKSLAAERLRKFKSTSKLYSKESFLRSSVDSCLHLLENSKDRVSHERLTDFINYTKSLDRNRKQNFENQFPELHNLLAVEGYAL